VLDQPALTAETQSKTAEEAQRKAERRTLIDEKQAQGA
jgi:hypothetical protein